MSSNLWCGLDEFWEELLGVSGSKEPWCKGMFLGVAICAKFALVASSIKGRRVEGDLIIAMAGTNVANPEP